MGYPRSNGRGYQSGSFGVSDHGALTGLTDDDHTQYATVAGDTFTGAVILPAGADTAPALQLPGTAGLFGTSSNMRLRSTDEFTWYFGTTAWVQLEGGMFRTVGAQDGTVDLGSSTGRWKDLRLGGFYYRSVTATITASTTQTQGQGALTKEVNEVSVCANANDTVTLPAAVAGAFCLVINNGAQTLQVFPASGDNLGAGVDTSTTIAAASRKLFVAFDATNWEPVI